MNTFLGVLPHLEPNNPQGGTERHQSWMTLVRIALKRRLSPSRLAAGSSYPFVQGNLGEGPGALVQVQTELLQAQLLLQKVAQVPLQEVPTGPLLDGLRKRPRHDEGWQLGRRGLRTAPAWGVQAPAPGRCCGCSGVSGPGRRAQAAAKPKPGEAPPCPLGAGNPSGRPHHLCRAARARPGGDKAQRSPRDPKSGGFRGGPSRPRERMQEITRGDGKA